MSTLEFEQYFGLNPHYPYDGSSFEPYIFNNDKNFYVDKIKAYYYENVNNNKMVSLVEFIIRSWDEVSMFFDVLIDIGFNPFVYKYPSYNNKPGTDFITYMIKFRGITARLNLLENKFHNEIINIVSTLSFFNNSTIDYIINSNDIKTVIHIVEMGKQYDILFNELFNIIINSYIGGLYHYLTIISNKSKKLTLNNGSYGKFVNYLKGLDSIEQFKMYKLIMKFDINVDLDKIDCLMIYRYLTKLESRIVDLENALLYSPDNQDASSPMNTAKADYENRGNDYFDK